MMRDEHGRPKTLFKTLRLMHGHNIDSGLNDLTEAFANFVTRARYFSIGHVRRTWSHSAVEFMKYRRRLPALTAGGDENDDDMEASSKRMSEGEDSAEAGLSMSIPALPSGSSDPRRIYVANVPARVTLKQLASFFTKFGRVASCTLPISAYSTIPKRTKGCAYVTFRSAEDAQVARSAQPPELTFYDRVMVVSTAASAVRKRHSFNSSSKPEGVEDDDSSVASAEIGETEATSPSSPCSTGGTPLDILSPKLLAIVISYLPLNDRIRVERVNKRWQEAAFKSWSQEKHLSFRHIFAPFRNRQLTNFAYKEVMRRCGPYVSSLDVSGAPTFMNDQCLKIVAEYCPNLKEVNFTGLKVRWQALKTFAEICGPHLESITYRDAYFMPEKAFWWLFRFSPQIQRVDLGNGHRLNGHCFRLLSFPLEDVRLDGCIRLDPDGVEQLCLKSPRVRRLRLDNCKRITDESLALISRSMNELQLFSLQGGPFPSLGTTGLMQIAKMSTIEVLNLNGNSLVTDDVLAVVAEGCPRLRVLTLAEAGTDDHLSKDGLAALTICSKLNEIDFSHLNACQDAVITELVAANPNFEVVRLRGCSRLTDTSVRVLAEKCWKTLRELDVSGCVAVSNRSVERFLEKRGGGGVGGGGGGSGGGGDGGGGCGSGGGGGTMLTVVTGGTSCDEPKLMRRIDSMKALDRFTIDTTDLSRRELLASASTAAGLKQMELGEGGFDEDNELSDDEFESLTAQRSFVLGELDQDDDDDDLLEGPIDQYLSPTVSESRPVDPAATSVLPKSTSPADPAASP